MSAKLCLFYEVFLTLKWPSALLKLRKNICMSERRTLLCPICLRLIRSALYKHIEHPPSNRTSSIFQKLSKLLRTIIERRTIVSFHNYSTIACGLCYAKTGL